MIGAARPSIADPFLPRKIEEGRLDDIRECIGCNICVSGDFTMTPMRCTQNPTMGEEWRRDWHPEIIAPKGSGDSVLIVGAGPAGLECARALGQRGYAVHLAEALPDLGGRVTRESKLPGLAAWARVRDHRLLQIEKMTNVSVYPASMMTAADVLELGCAHVVVATGARWRRDGVGRSNALPIPGFDGAALLTPDDLMDGAASPVSPVVIFDDDHYYMGGVLAEQLRSGGVAVTLVTPEDSASQWTHNTLEHERIQTRLLEMGVAIAANRNVTAFRGDHVETACVFTGRTSNIPCERVVTVTARLPDDGLYTSLAADPAALRAAGIKSVTAIADALCPATIAHAIHAGHRYARELDAAIDRDAPFRRERAM
jgi:dimethylamine/trimethylamine dehydrogenase